MAAIAKGDLREVATALKRGSARASRLRIWLTPREATPLILAVQKGTPEIVALLLDAGADVNGDTRFWNTPLAVACRGGNLALIKLLLARGADVNRARPNHASAMEEAAFGGRAEVVDLLRLHGGEASQVLDGAVESLIRVPPAILRRLAAEVDLVSADVQKLLGTLDECRNSEHRKK